MTAALTNLNGAMGLAALSVLINCLIILDILILFGDVKTVTVIIPVSTVMWNDEIKSVKSFQYAITTS